MSLWGSAKDPAQAKQYDLPYMDEAPFPAEPTHTIPPPEATMSQASTTKSYEKPTVSATEPLASIVVSSVISTPTPTPTNQDDVASPDESGIPDDESLNDAGSWEWVSDGAEYVSDRKVAFGVGVAIFLFCLFVLVFVLIRRRRAARHRDQYFPVADQEEMRMGLVNSGHDQRSFGGGASTAGDDSGERMRLTGPNVVEDSVGLGYHSEFLDDDDPERSSTPVPKYQDLPDDSNHDGEHGRS